METQVITQMKYKIMEIHFANRKKEANLCWSVSGGDNMQIALMKVLLINLCQLLFFFWNYPVQKIAFFHSTVKFVQTIVAL